jgi:hypothetical protein
MSAARTLLIVVVDAGMAFALWRLHLGRRGPRGVVPPALAAILVLPAAILLATALATLAGRPGSSHRVLSERPSQPPRVACSHDPDAARC